MEACVWQIKSGTAVIILHMLLSLVLDAGSVFLLRGGGARRSDAPLWDNSVCLIKVSTPNCRQQSCIFRAAPVTMETFLNSGLRLH